MCTCFKTKTDVSQNLIDDFLSNFDYQKTFHRKNFKLKNNGCTFWKKGSFACRTKDRKQPPVVILQQSIFYNIFIRCLWLRIIRRSDEAVYFMNFPSHIFFNDINQGYRAGILKKSSLWLLSPYMAVATYCYYEKVRRTTRTATVSYLLKPRKQWWT